jgi:hypothetical protein
MISLKQATFIASILGACSSVQDAAAQGHLPKPVRAELDRLLSDCRKAGGQPTVNPGAITKAALTDDNFADHIIWTAKIDCDGAFSIFGGAAGQTLVLIPAYGRGVRHIPTHTWRLVGEGPMTVEFNGGFDCATGHQDRCDGRLKWDGSAFVGVNDVRIQRVNQTTRGQSIVGDWAETHDGCASPMAGLVRIGPKSLTTDEMSCSFTEVSRTGPIVTWKGSCNEGGQKKSMSVTATENGGRLTIRFKNGKAWAPLMSCPHST